MLPLPVQYVKSYLSEQSKKCQGPVKIKSDGPGRVPPVPLLVCTLVVYATAKADGGLLAHKPGKSDEGSIAETSQTQATFDKIFAAIANTRAALEQKIDAGVIDMGLHSDDQRKLAERGKWNKEALEKLCLESTQLKNKRKNS
ncbi:hypothetical protein NDU88_005297 [Pleurodeles waltl]|uniref:Uncharacterized protein n=1 Tax=Pleurodeles waltl TaxID=8319 RepID=A0AAV7V7K5_PLEWA|nr:hypothetical protein NDU88_005297 [Pleurodeles waltl]